VGVQHCQIPTSTSKIDLASIHPTRKLICRYIDHFGRSTDKNIFCQRLPRPERPQSKIWPGNTIANEVLGVVIASRKLDSNTKLIYVCRRSKDIAGLATFTMVSKALEELGTAVLPESP